MKGWQFKEGVGVTSCPVFMQISRPPVIVIELVGRWRDDATWWVMTRKIMTSIMIMRRDVLALGLLLLLRQLLNQNTLLTLWWPSCWKKWWRILPSNVDGFRGAMTMKGDKLLTGCCCWCCSRTFFSRRRRRLGGRRLMDFDLLN